jgi:hypothetical protein
MGLAKELVASIDASLAPARARSRNNVAINDRDGIQLTARA